MKAQERVSADNNKDAYPTSRIDMSKPGSYPLPPGNVITPFLEEMHEDLRLREAENTITPANAMLDENYQLLLF